MGNKLGDNHIVIFINKKEYNSIRRLFLVVNMLWYSHLINKPKIDIITPW